MKNIYRIVFTLAVFTLLFTPEKNVYAKKKGESITMAGSTTVLPIAQKTAEVFMNKNPDVNISVRGGGSSVGVAAIIDGTVDIGNSSRPIQTKELALGRSKGRILKEIPIARDGIAVIVHKDNPVENLSLEQLRDIFTGKIANWKELGGKNMPIVVVSRDTSSGTFETFKEKVLKNAKVKDQAIMTAANQAVLTTVMDTPGAIGYVGIGFVSDDIKVLSINGIKASKDSVIKGTYPVSRKLYMYVNGEPQGLVKRYIDFVLSEEGQSIVEEIGYVRVK